jgi:hypothetical protein
MKFFNKKTTVDGHVFDSLKEVKRYEELCLLAWTGEIRELTVHPTFELIPKFTIEVSGKKKAIRATTYTADFSYVDHTGKIIVEDVKAKNGFQAPVFKIKCKLFLYHHHTSHELRIT